MGRYYDGDISGKFWFGVQASDDADFFGVEGSAPNYIEYNFYEENMDEVKAGIEKCKEALGENLKRLDEFFDKPRGYNDDILKEAWVKDYKVELSDRDIQEMLQWYARLGLGEQILECLEASGQCEFRAEV